VSIADPDHDCKTAGDGLATIGFLHQFSELDTLGIDKPETACRAYAR
jgi:hypothetical protein